MPFVQPASQSVKPRPPVFKEELRGGIPSVLIDGPKTSGPAPMIFNAAAKSAEYADRLRAHYRETRRTTVAIPCSLEVVLDDGEIYDFGSAQLSNISPSGAFVTQVKLPGGSLPTESFKLRLVLNGDPYAGIGIEASPVRVTTQGGFGLGIRFDEIFVAV